MSLENDLDECLAKKKALSKKRGRLMIYDKVATSAGVMSLCALPISMIALIPLGASIGLSVYVNKKDEETFEKMRVINSKYSDLKSQQKYKKI